MQVYKVDLEEEKKIHFGEDLSSAYHVEFAAKAFYMDLLFHRIIIVVRWRKSSVKFNCPFSKVLKKLFLYLCIRNCIRLYK